MFRSALFHEIAGSAIVLGAGFALDGALRPNFPDRRGPLGYLEEPGEVFGGAAFLISTTGGLAAGGFALRRPPLLRFAKRLGIAVGAATVTVGALKLVTHRQRPDGSNYYSFPSGHTGAAFAAATVVDREVGGVAGWLAYAGAAMAGEARLANNHHYFSDVVAGMLVGRAIGRLVSPARRNEAASRPGAAPDADGSGR